MKKRKISGLFVLGFLALIALSSCVRKPEQKVVTNDIYKGVEFKMPEVVVPKFPDNKVSITDFGAVPGGRVLNTGAIAKAIDAVVNKGGGTVVIPRGLWLTGPIILKSNVNLHVEEGALVVFSKDFNLYPLIWTSFEGLNTMRCLSPIYGKDLKNVAITGKGVFDGNGQAWRMVHRSKVTSSEWKKLVASGGVVDQKKQVWYPSKSSMEGAQISDMNVPVNLKTKAEFEKVKDFLRPVMVSLVSCKNVLLDGPVFKNSPAWTIHPLKCENLTVRNISAINPWNAQNSDGIDIESCKNSVVYDCSFNVGDDGICIKSGKNSPGHICTDPTENLIIKNCVVYHAHGGVTIGSEMSGGVKNVHVSNCTFIGTDSGLRFKSKRGRGGVVENIYMSDIDMLDIPTRAISFNMHYGGASLTETMKDRSFDSFLNEPAKPVNQGTPEFKNIYFRNIVCDGAAQAIYLRGLPEMSMKNVVLENIQMQSKQGLFAMDVEGLKIRNLNLKTAAFPAMIFLNTWNVNLDKIDFPVKEKPFVTFVGPKTKNIQWAASDSIKQFIEFMDGAKPGILRLTGSN